MADIARPGTYHVNYVGSNTVTQVTAKPTILYFINIQNNSGSSGFLQVYDNGSAQVTAGTNMQMNFGVGPGTLGGGTPAAQNIDFGPYGVTMNGGLSYLWASGTTGTAVAAGNALVNIVYKPVNIA